METDLIKYFLPSQLVEHFDVERVEERPIPGSRLLELHIHLSDKNQWLRLCVAFERYPELRRAYHHANRLRSVFSSHTREQAQIALDEWIRQTRIHGHATFKSAANSIRWHSESILNFFDNRSTNASAESFNARIKLFRANQRGVRDTSFFLFRLTKLYA